MCAHSASVQSSDFPPSNQISDRKNIIYRNEKQEMYHIAVLVAPPQWNFGVIFHLNVDAGFTATAFAIVFSLIEFFNGTFFDSDLCSAAYTISFYLHHCTNTVINMQKKSFHKINIMYCSSLQALLLCTPQKIHFTNMKNESNVKLFVLLFSCAFFSHSH